MKKFLAVFMARNKEFFLDKGTLAWVILFPILLIFGFSIAFSGNNQSLYKIGIIGKINQTGDFYSIKYIQFIKYASKEKALTKLRHHQIDFLVEPQKNNYWVNTNSPNSYIVEKLFLASKTSKNYIKETITGKAIRYVDWVMPGILGMNIMFNSLFGVGFVIVRYRRNGVLKRLKATPLSAFEFITAQIISRLLIVLGISTFVFLGCNFFLKFLILGSLLDIFIIAIIGSFCHITLGLLFASRLKNEELANGLINIVSWPMMLLSGVWFSLEGSPKFLQTISNFFPLTHFITAIRKIMLDGASLIDVAPHIIFLSILSLFFLVLSSLLFSWDK